MPKRKQKEPMKTPQKPSKILSKDEAVENLPDEDDAVLPEPEKPAADQPAVYRFRKTVAVRQRVWLEPDWPIQFSVARRQDKTYAPEGTYETTDLEIVEKLRKIIKRRPSAGIYEVTETPENV